jgi:intracellular multiplication protein IcmC
MYWRIILIFSSVLALSSCTSANTPDLGNMLGNLTSTYPALFQLITAFAYVFGFLLALRAVYALKVYGEARAMMSSNASMKQPIAYLIAAAGLIFSPTAYQDFLLTIFGDPNTTPLSYATGKSTWSLATLAVLGLVQIMGVIAFVRGWIYIARAGDQSAQQGNFAKGLTHIIGGIMAINIVGVKDIITNTLGL